MYYQLLSTTQLLSHLCGCVVDDGNTTSSMPMAPVVDAIALLQGRGVPGLYTPPRRRIGAHNRMPPLGSVAIVCGCADCLWMVCDVGGIMGYGGEV